MIRIGCHLSSSKGFLHMGKEAVSIGANTFQFFTRNPRGSKAKAIDEKDVENFLEYAKEQDICQILAHAPYTLNACSADEHTREFALMTMEDDLKRMEYIPGNCYNFHPGSHVGQGIEKGIQEIADTLNRILRPEQRTTVLLETMAGKGSEVGGRFEDLAGIIDRVELKEKMGYRNLRPPMNLDELLQYDDPDEKYYEHYKILSKYSTKAKASDETYKQYIRERKRDDLCRGE